MASKLGNKSYKLSAPLLSIIPGSLQVPKSVWISRGEAFMKLWNFAMVISDCWAKVCKRWGRGGVVLRFNWEGLGK